jgi:DNA-binding protein H-NS
MSMKMSEKYKDLSQFQIRAMIKELVDELDRRDMEKMEVITNAYRAALKDTGYSDEEVSSAEKIKELMLIVDNNKNRPIGAKIRVSDYATRPMRIVRPKYRHSETGNEWAGRGAFAPPWVLKVMQEKGWTLEEFKNSDEFKIKSDKAD